MKSNQGSASLNGSDRGTAEDLEAVQVFDAYLKQIQEGQPANPAQLLADHPALADRLRAFLNVAHLVDRVAGDRAPALDDFRIIREIGRGGMGIVYEAEQLSRGRRVALKVLPSAAALDPRQLRRFQVEVQAAQLLRHEHIVPISSFGCEQGVYYYAMQYVEGKNLAEVIAGLKKGPEPEEPDPKERLPKAPEERLREVARWGCKPLKPSTTRTAPACSIAISSRRTC